MMQDHDRKGCIWILVVELGTVAVATRRAVNGTQIIGFLYFKKMHSYIFFSIFYLQKGHKILT